MFIPFRSTHDIILPNKKQSRITLRESRASGNRFITLLLTGSLLSVSGLSLSQETKSIEFTENQLQNLIAVTRSLQELQLDTANLEAASPEEQMQALKQNPDVMKVYDEFGYSPENHLSGLSSIQQAMEVSRHPAEIETTKSTLEQIEESIRSLQLQQMEVKNRLDSLVAEYSLVPESNVSLVAKHQAEIVSLFAEPSE